MKKKALIFGVTGQDGSYLSEFLIKKIIRYMGLKKIFIFKYFKSRSSLPRTSKKNRNFILHYGDITDSFSVNSIIQKVKPDEIYNLAAQSHVAVSFEVPEYTANADAIGSLRILESIRHNGLEKKQNSTKRALQKCLVKFKLYHKMKKLIFILESLWCSKSICTLGYCKL